MKKFYPKFILLIFSLSLLFTTGCPKKPPPTPADTVLGYPQDYGVLEDVYSEDLPELRDENINNAVRTEGVLPSIYFDFDQDIIKDSERMKLPQAATYLQDNSNQKLLIEGFCDWRGTSEYNLALGDRRANAVKRYLNQMGIGPERIQTLSRGDLDAMVNGTKEQMAKDRRADLVILP